jgi:hypothetical protein
MRIVERSSAPSVRLLLTWAAICCCLPALARAQEADLHAAWDALLARYVVEAGVRYDGWAGVAADRQALSDYIDRLEAIDPASLSKDAALAFWLNLYNAATLELVLAHYPVKSIKDIGGPLNSPWKRAVVTVAGHDYSLDAIENDVVRPTFQDARIHFALNCAAVGCPPLARKAYRAEQLGAQLDQACRRALGDSRWVEVSPRRIRLTKIFDWYAADFQHEGNTVRKFLARYRPDDAAALQDEDRRLEYRDYDWSLNQAPASR